MDAMNQATLRGLGVLFWVLVIMVAGITARRDRGSSAAEVAQHSLRQYYFGWVEKVPAIDPSSQLRVHDPVFLFKDGASKDSGSEDHGSWVQIGYVQSVSPGSADSPSRVTLAWHGGQWDAQPYRFLQYRNGGRLEDVVAVMLPPEKRLEIQQRLAVAMSQHGDELSAAFVPLVQQSLRRSLPLIEEELRSSALRHRGQIDALLGRWNEELMRERLIPLARREIMPIIREHGEPQAEAIGRELWDRASIWRFGWRAVYDKSPLPKKDLVQEEWDRFVEDQAVPVFESHMDEIVVAVQRIVMDVAANEQVRGEVAEVASQIAADPEMQKLIRRMLSETLIDNPRLRQLWSEVWTSDEARRALDLAGDRLEPVVRRIGDDLFGTPREGINPNFARVLRNQILGKDRRWIVAVPSVAPEVAATPVIEVASRTGLYPIVYTADRSENP